MNIEEMVIGVSPAVKKLRKEISRLSKLDRVLIVGEKGTGKSLVARAVYDSLRSKSELVILNPLTSSDRMLRESFTKPSTNSTILIQEIEEFSFLSQGIIAQFIQGITKKTGIRCIVTTKRNINTLKKQGTILPDLFSALKSFNDMEIPPLKERREDIPLLVEHFINNACEATGKKIKVMDVNALDFLIRREWQQNVLELKNVIEKAVLSSEGTDVELPEYLANEYAQLEGIVTNIKDNKAFSFDKSLSNIEKSLIEKTLQAVGFNQTKAADLLGIGSANLRYRLRKFKIPSSRKRNA